MRGKLKTIQFFLSSQLLICILAACAIILKPTAEEQLAFYFPDIAQLPSWRGLTPNSSTIEDIESFIQANEIQDVAFNTSFEQRSDQHTWLDKTYLSSVKLTSDQGLLSSISFYSSNDVDVPAFIAQFGQPQGFLVEYHAFERPAIITTLFFEDHGLLAYSTIFIADIDRKQRHLLETCEFDLRTGTIDRILLAESAFIESTIGEHPRARPLSDWQSLGNVTIQGCDRD